MQKTNYTWDLEHAGLDTNSVREAIKTKASELDLHALVSSVIQCNAVGTIFCAFLCSFRLYSEAPERKRELKFCSFAVRMLGVRACWCACNQVRKRTHFCATVWNSVGLIKFAKRIVLTSCVWKAIERHKNQCMQARFIGKCLEKYEIASNTMARFRYTTVSFDTFQQIGNYLMKCHDRVSEAKKFQVLRCPVKKNWNFPQRIMIVVPLCVRTCYWFTSCMTTELGWSLHGWRKDYVGGTVG